LSEVDVFCVFSHRSSSRRRVRLPLQLKRRTQAVHPVEAKPRRRYFYFFVIDDCFAEMTTGKK